MSNGKLIAGTLIAMTIAAVFLTPLSTVVATSTGVVGVGNESVTIHTDEYSDLDGYDVTNNYTVELEDGTELTEGTDYEINRTEGSITAVSGSATVSDGDTVLVTYEYNATDSTTGTIAGLVPMFAALLILGIAAAKMREMM